MPNGGMQIGEMYVRIGADLTNFQNNMARARTQLESINNAMAGTQQVAKTMTQRLKDSSASFNDLNKATNNLQVQRAFSQIEGAIRRTRTELSLLGFGKTQAEVKALEAQMYQFANVRMDRLRDEIKLTEKAIDDMKKSANSADLTEQIKEAEAALAEYKKQLSDTEPVKKMAEVNGYAVQKMFGKDVIVKPLEDSMARAKAILTGFMNKDLAVMANTTYQTIDNAAKRIVGSTTTIAEQKAKITQLAGAYTMLGTTINTMVTPAILALSAGITLLSNKYENMVNKFQSQTLTMTSNMGEFKNEMLDVWVKTGQSFDQIGTTFSYLRNQLGETSDTIKQTAMDAITLAGAWGLKNEEVAQSILDIQTQTGKSKATVLDMFALSLKKNQGDIQKAKQDIMDFFPIYDKLTQAGRNLGLSESEIRVLAQKKVSTELLNQNAHYQSLINKADQLNKAIQAAKTPQEELKLREQLKTVMGEISQSQSDAAKYSQQQVDSFRELSNLDGSKAFETMANAKGPLDKLGESLRNLGASAIRLFETLAPTLTRIADGLTLIGDKANAFLRANPGIASFAMNTLAAGAAVTILIGAFSPIAAILIRSRILFQALAISMGAAAMGGTAVLNPAAIAMARSFTMMRSAIIGLPAILSGLGPAALTFLRALPMAVGKFVIDFVKINPLFTAFSILGIVIAKNWDRVGPVLSKIWQDVQLAFAPAAQAFKSAGATIFPVLLDILNKVTYALGTGIVFSLKIIEPIIKIIAQLLNGDFAGAWKTATLAMDQVGAKFTWLKTFIEEHKIGLQTTAVILTTLFGPALLVTGVQATIAGAQLLGNFVKNIVLAGTEAIVAGAKITGSFIVSMIQTSAQAVITGATIMGSLVTSLTSYIAAGWITVTQVGLQTGAWIAQKAAIIASTAVTYAMSAAQWALNVAMDANPIGIIILAIGALVAAGIYLYNNWEIVKQKFIEWGPTILSLLGPVGMLASFVITHWDLVKTTTIEIFSKVKDFFVQWGPIILAILTGPIGIAVYAVINNWETLQSKAQTIFEAVKRFINDPIGEAKKLLIGHVTDMANLFRNLVLKIPTPSLPSLPHFSLDWSSANVFGRTIDYPTGFNVNWHATGGIFAGPSVIGVGEAGPEAVVPLSGARMKPFAEEIARQFISAISPYQQQPQYNRETNDITPLVEAIFALADRDVVLQVDGREIIRATAKYIDPETERLKDQNRRFAGGR